jgi:hypothetical protein
LITLLAAMAVWLETNQMPVKKTTDIHNETRPKIFADFFMTYLLFVIDEIDEKKLTPLT